MSVLKTLLASVYNEIYTENSYLLKFDAHIINTIETLLNNLTIDRTTRKVIIDGTAKYQLRDVS